MTALAESLDRMTIDELYRRGSLKWSRRPRALGAFVAEMDFGTAPAVTAALHDASTRASSATSRRRRRTTWPRPAPTG